MRRPALCVAWVALSSFLALAGESSAELCTIDAVPAATLLLPYFEVSLEGQHPGEVNTLFSVNNASAAPAVAHITLWGDWSLPSIDFDIFLTGYDVQTVSLASVFNNGEVPITAHAARDVLDTISPHKNNPAWDSAPDNPANPLFASCDTNLPLGTNPVLSQGLLDRIRNGHTGQPDESFGGGCIGEAHGDGIARGYVTIDNVNECNVLFPNQDGYFGTGLVSNVNQLWGDYFIVQWGFAFGDSLVHIEAGDDAFDPGDYTFYGRYVGGLATDGREPLATTWAARYFDETLFGGATDFIVWRDSKWNDPGVAAFTCGVGGPDWWPLNETQGVMFDEMEDAVEVCLPDDQPNNGISPPPDPEEDPTCFPIETGRYRVGGASVPGADELESPFPSGWSYLNLNHTLGVGVNAGLFGDIAQSWVITNLDAVDFDLSVGFPAVQLTNACSNANPLIVGSF